MKNGHQKMPNGAVMLMRRKTPLSSFFATGEWRCYVPGLKKTRGFILAISKGKNDETNISGPVAD